MPVCPRREKTRAGGAERGRAHAPPLSLRGRSDGGFCFFMPVICLLLMMLLFLLLLLLLLPEGTKGRSPQNVKTAAPETQQMMGAENIRYRRNYERIFF